MTTKSIEERLKYWYIRCVACDEKIMERQKKEKSEFYHKCECQGCKNPIEIWINMDLPVKIIEKDTESQRNFISCIFRSKSISPGQVVAIPDTK